MIMKKIKANISHIALFFILATCSLSSFSETFTFSVDNINPSSQFNTEEAVYIYPDASLAYFVPYLYYQDDSSCKTNSTCMVVYGNKIDAMVYKVAGARQTTLCLSTEQPSGSFDHCAPKACVVTVDFQNASLQKSQEPECSNFYFNNNSNSQSKVRASTYTVYVKPS